MGALDQQGLIRAIGVSNFTSDRLVDLIEHNQVTRRSTRSRLIPSISAWPSTGSCWTAACSTSRGALSPKEK
jgi:hypothetical protein